MNELETALLTGDVVVFSVRCKKTAKELLNKFGINLEMVGKRVWYHPNSHHKPIPFPRAFDRTKWTETDNHPVIFVYADPSEAYGLAHKNLNLTGDGLTEIGVHSPNGEHLKKRMEKPNDKPSSYFG